MKVFTKSILIICANNLLKAPRFTMEIEALKNNYKIIALGLNSSTNQDYDYIELRKKNISFHLNYPKFVKKTISLFIRFYIKYFNKYGIKSKTMNLLKTIKPSLIIVHHINELPLGAYLAKYHKTKLIFNAHEYYPLEFNNDKKWMETTHLKINTICKEYLPKVAVCFCVGEIIAKKYASEFKLKSIVINNSKKYYNLKPQPSSGIIKLIHHGAAIPSRKIEVIIEMMKHLGGNYILDFILMPNDLSYLNHLKELAKPFSNINFLKPVGVDELPIYTNKYDIGVFLLPPTNYNYQNALPNKFFEFIQARLVIAIGPSPEMAKIVKQNNIGLVANDFEPITLAAKIKTLSYDNIMEIKTNTHLSAKKLNIENNFTLINNAVSDLIN